MKSLVKLCEETNASNVLKAIVTLKTLATHVKSTMISVNNKSFKPTKYDMQQAFYTVLTVRILTFLAFNAILNSFLTVLE